MIRSLRRRFLLIAMASLVGTLTVLCLAINIGYRCLSTGQSDTILSLIYRSDGQFFPPDGLADPYSGGFQITRETPFETRYFMVRLSPLREVTAIDLDHIAALDRQMVLSSVADILASGRASGYTGYYRYAVFDEPGGGSTIIVLDRFLQLQGANNVLRISVLVSLACAGIVFVLLLVLSGRVIRPFAENLERQRQFVTDASHELKTPVAIIAANTGLLQADLGDNRWLESTQTQVSRLDRLIRDLIELARTEETQAEEGAFAPVPLSELAARAVEDFVPLARAEGRELVCALASGITVTGEEDKLTRLCGLLLDNAVKYCDPDGTIRVELTRRGRAALLSVSNPCASLDPAQLPRLFDRFYRADPSRSRGSGGYGIGLSTARAIVTRHRGKLTARCADGVVTFTVQLPLVRPDQRQTEEGGRH